MADRIDTAAERVKLAALEGHTPGPWAYEPHGDTMTYGVGVCEDVDVPGVALSGQVDSDALVLDPVAAEVYGQQNARLIAAAPDLKATLVTALDALDAERARAEKAEAERDEWIETARHHSKAEAAFLGWLRIAGEHMRAFGVTICDDGSDAGEVLVAKVPGCAKAMAGRITDLEAERDQSLARLAAVRDEIDRLRKALERVLNIACDEAIDFGLITLITQRALSGENKK